MEDNMDIQFAPRKIRNRCDRLDYQYHGDLWKKAIFVEFAKDDRMAEEIIRKDTMDSKNKQKLEKMLKTEKNAIKMQKCTKTWEIP